MSFIQQCVNVTGPKKLVVVFDGGGVRGRFSLDLCCCLAREQPVPLTKLVGMSVGVSAGGIVASWIALGMLDDFKINPSACDAFYTTLPDVFQKPNKGGPLFQPKYDGSGKRRALVRMFGNKRLGDAKIPLMILCCSMDGEPIEYRSWNPQQQHISLVDILDASSAAPGFFPPVRVENTWLTDGGVRANKPLLAALLATMDLFHDQACNIHMLSIGTNYAPVIYFEPRLAPFMGILNWVRRRITDAMLGMQDHTSERLMFALFGKRFLRLECECNDISLDDATSASQTRLHSIAESIFNNQKQQILQFVQKL